MFKLQPHGFRNRDLRQFTAEIRGVDPDSVTVGQMTYDLHAPRGALSYPQCSWEELEGRFLGPMAHLDAKARGDSSLPGKQRSCSGV